MKKILATLALLTAIATPAFAQDYIPSYGPGSQDYIPPYGTENVLPFAYKSTAQDTQSIARASAEQAYDMAPLGSNNLSRFSPAFTGGGSVGYNQAEQQAVMNR